MNAQQSYASNANVITLPLEGPPLRRYCNPCCRDRADLPGTGSCDDRTRLRHETKFYTLSSFSFPATTPAYSICIYSYSGPVVLLSQDVHVPKSCQASRFVLSLRSSPGIPGFQTQCAGTFPVRSSTLYLWHAWRRTRRDVSFSRLTYYGSNRPGKLVMISYSMNGMRRILMPPEYSRQNSVESWKSVRNRTPEKQAPGTQSLGRELNMRLYFHSPPS
jgi:hypothetical protein